MGDPLPAEQPGWREHCRTRHRLARANGRA